MSFICICVRMYVPDLINITSAAMTQFPCGAKVGNWHYSPTLFDL